MISMKTGCLGEGMTFVLTPRNAGPWRAIAEFLDAQYLASFGLSRVSRSGIKTQVKPSGASAGCDGLDHSGFFGSAGLNTSNAALTSPIADSAINPQKIKNGTSIKTALLCLVDYSSALGEAAGSASEAAAAARLARSAHPVGNTGYTSKQLALGQAVNTPLLSGVRHG
jgi:hypothetical protein